MTPETKRNYYKQARYFFRKYLPGRNSLTLNDIIDALDNCIGDYTVASWRKVRRSLVVWLQVHNRPQWARYIDALQHPIHRGDIRKPKGKLARKKGVTLEEHLMLREYCKKKQDAGLFAAIELAWLLGCRPCEMPTIQLLPEYQIQIIGAKKNSQGNRGLDRILNLTDHQFKIVVQCLEMLAIERAKVCKPNYVMKRIQRRLETANKILWPEQKARITLYSYRHQLGSDYKGSGMPRLELAAIMGHQSVDSANAYGDSRRKSGRQRIHASQASINTVRKTQLKYPDFLQNIKTSRTQIRESPLFH